MRGRAFFLPDFFRGWNISYRFSSRTNSAF
jgi:hypothetical protein